MIIDNVKNIDELNAVLDVVQKIFPKSVIDLDGDGKYNRNFWIEKFNEHPELLLYAKIDGEICGSVFAWEDNGDITVGHCGVLNEYQKQGVGKALMLETENRVKNLDFHGISLGSAESAEGFYEKLGYTGALLIQSDTHSIEELKFMNEREKNYDIIWTNIYEGTINQICLRVPISDREFQRKYETAFDNCWTQMIYGKNF
ncbi:MAG: GNAT family N-acetyltransferase [Oscillospiraceae bacterium]|nr:GNAT family N-acetyltransferase [Oscillospiraceae bacterium]